MGRNIKHRIVTETVFAGRRGHGDAFPETFRNERYGVPGMPEIGHQADKPAPAFVLRKLCDIINEFFQVICITCADTGITGGVNPGAAVKCIKFNTGIIRNGGQSGMPRRVARLEQGVLDKGGPGLLDGRHVEFRLRDDLHRVPCQHLTNLAHLAGVAAG